MESALESLLDGGELTIESSTPWLASRKQHLACVGRAPRSGDDAAGQKWLLKICRGLRAR